MWSMSTLLFNDVLRSVFLRSVLLEIGCYWLILHFGCCVQFFQCLWVLSLVFWLVGNFVRFQLSLVVCFTVFTVWLVGHCVLL